MRILFSAFSIIIGIVGSVLGIYGYFEQKQRTQVSYQSSVRYYVSPTDWKLQITKNGKPLSNPILESIVVIENTGNTVISRENLREYDGIKIDAPGIIDFKVTPSVGVVKLTENLDQDGSLILGFDKLDPGATISVLFLSTAKIIDGKRWIPGGAPVANAFGLNGVRITKKIGLYGKSLSIFTVRVAVSLIILAVVLPLFVELIFVKVVEKFSHRMSNFKGVAFGASVLVVAYISFALSGVLVDNPVSRYFGLYDYTLLESKILEFDMNSYNPAGL